MRSVEIAVGDARRAARRALPRDPADDAAPAARAAEPAARRVPRPRARAAAVAGPASRCATAGRSILVAPLPPPLRAPDAAAVPRRSSRRRAAAGTRSESRRRSARPPPTRARSRATASGRTCHPRLPFADWAACRPALEQARRGDRRRLPRRRRRAAARLRADARRGAALEMALGIAGGSPAVGFLLSPAVLPVSRRRDLEDLREELRASAPALRRDRRSAPAAPPR